MARFLQYLFAGLSAGSLYALVALGLVLVYRATRVLNFFHGDLAAFVTFLAFTLLGLGLPFGAALPAGLLGGAVLVTGVYFGILLPAQRREATLLSQVILTLGVALVLQGGMTVFWGADPERFPFPLSDTRVLRLGRVIMSELHLAMLGVGLVAAGALYGVVQRTRLGLAMRAVSENLMAAQTLGLPTRWILALAWILASILGGLAGVFLAPVLLLDPFFMLDPFLKGFAAAVLGGMASLPGAIVGGLLLGVAESLIAGYLWLQFKNTLAFLVIILVLLIRPEGLLGRDFQERV